MQVSIGIYALIFIFFFIVIPGFIARRFYYNGEFSKHINWTNNSITNFLSVLFVGIILCIGYISIINVFRQNPINIDNVLNKIDQLILSEGDQSSEIKFNGFSREIYQIYIPFITGMYIIAAVVGLFFSKFVLLFDLDTKWKFLRFSNTWHYLFQGRILKIKSSSKYENVQAPIKYTYLDILVAEKDSETTLYSGLYANYDLSFSESNKLEKIYLYKAIRYKKTDRGIVKREIPGNIFTILGENILNINATYILYDKIEEKERKFNQNSKLIVTVQIVAVLFFLFLMILFLFSINPFSSTILNMLIAKSVIAKILILLCLNMILGLLTPFDINAKEKEIKYIGNKSMLLRVVVCLIFSAIIYFLFF